MAQWLIVILKIKGLLVRDSLKELCCVLRKTLYPLLGTGSTQEYRKLSQNDCKIVDWDIKHQHKLYNYVKLC